MKTKPNCWAEKLLLPVLSEKSSGISFRLAVTSTNTQVHFQKSYNTFYLFTVMETSKLKQRLQLKVYKTQNGGSVPFSFYSRSTKLISCTFRYVLNTSILKHPFYWTAKISRRKVDYKKRK